MSDGHIEVERRDDTLRSTGAIIGEMLAHVQEIIHSEIQLAKVEVKDEAIKAGRAGGLFGAAGILGFYAVGLIIVTCLAALAIAIPVWAAALCMAVLVILIAWGFFAAGREQIKKVNAVPRRTVQTIKDDIQWAKNQTS